MTEAIPLAEPVILARPRWVRSSGVPAPAWPLAIAGLTSFTLSLIIDPDRGLLGAFSCPWRALTGLPCLGCGGTHAFSDLAKSIAALPSGNLAQSGQLAIAAIAANPLWALAAAILWIAAIVSLAQLFGLRWTFALPSIPARKARSLRFAGALLIAINWAFVATR